MRLDRSRWLHMEKHPLSAVVAKPLPPPANVDLDEADLRGRSLRFVPDEEERA